MTNHLAPKRETAKALAAFTLYRDFGPNRSLASVGKALGKSQDLMERWSSAHHWVERAEKHDREIAAKDAAADQKAKLADLARRKKARLQLSDGVRGVAAAGLRQLNETVQYDPEKLGEDGKPMKPPRPMTLEPREIVMLLAHADKTERLDTEQPTERMENTGAGGEPLPSPSVHIYLPQKEEPPDPGLPPQR